MLYLGKAPLHKVCALTEWAIRFKAIVTSRAQHETSALDNTKQFVNHPFEATNTHWGITHTLLSQYNTEELRIIKVSVDVQRAMNSLEGDIVINSKGRFPRLEATVCFEQHVQRPVTIADQNKNKCAPQKFYWGPYLVAISPPVDRAR